MTRAHGLRRLLAGLCCIGVAISVDLWPVTGTPTVQAQGVVCYRGTQLASNQAANTQSGRGTPHPHAGNLGGAITGGIAGAIVGGLAGFAGGGPVGAGFGAAVGVVVGAAAGAGACGPQPPCVSCNLQPPAPPIYAPDLYLYPQHPETVHVTLAGTVTTSSPPYGPDGWTVQATPNPQGHLFYEAAASEPWQTARGWVVRAAGWTAWIESELPRLGLNPTETADFAHDWATDLPPSPYYLVAPQPASLINAAVGLRITPRPDTLYRLWLFIVPLKAPVPVAPPHISPPERRGFTVVEWGVTFPAGVYPPCAPEVACAR